MDSRKYIQVILPLRLDWLPWYCTEEMDVEEGMRVSVKFASHRYVGVVARVCDKPEIEESRVMKAERIERGLECITPQEMKLWEFVSDYYLCSVGEVYKSAYPLVRIEKEEAVVRAAERRSAAAQRNRDRLAAQTAARLGRLRARLDRKLVELGSRHSAAVQSRLEAERDKLLKEIELLTSYNQSISLDEDTSGIDYEVAPATTKKPDSEVPDTALNDIRLGVPVLLRCPLHDRQDFYVQIIRKTLEAGHTVLLIAPEIAVAKELAEVISSAVGPASALLYHSGLTPAQRRRVADAVRRTDDSPIPAGEGTESRKNTVGEGHKTDSSGVLVVGTRSAVMLPFADLGLVIVEDEHSAAYKQDVTPRYNARDLAVILAGIHGARVILGSDTPSLESLFNLSIGRYSEIHPSGALASSLASASQPSGSVPNSGSASSNTSASDVFIGHRVADDIYPPEGTDTRQKEIPVEIVDTKAERRKNGMVEGFSRILIGHIRSTVSSGGQVMLLRSWGTTQFLEEETRTLFPDLNVFVLDRDSIGTADDQKADIIISTMGVTRHFDFSALKLVALMQADSLLSRQDFRADERAVQLLSQFRRRCSNSGSDGLFVIQTAQASHPVYQALSSRGGELRMDWLLAERQDFSYPPFGRMIDVLVRDPNPSRLATVSEELAARIAQAGLNVAGVFDIASSRVVRILLSRDKQLKSRKEDLRRAVRDFEKEHSYSGHIHFDVDPA